MLIRLLVLGILGAILSTGIVRAQLEGVTQQVFARGTMDYSAAVDGPAEVYVGAIRIEPGSSYGGWHTHPGPVWVVVSNSELAVYGPGGCRTTYPAGYAYLAEPDTPYDLRNETMEPLELVFAGVIRAGQRPTLPALDPMAACDG